MSARLAVIGNPIAHSRSPEIHGQFAAQTGIDVDYSRLLVPEGEFEQRARAFLDAGATGFNVTVPFKGDAYRFVSRSSQAAIRSEAVNTVSLDSKGNTVGDNTDGPGLVQDISVNLGWSLSGGRLLVLGAGGAVRGVLNDLLDCNPQSIHLYNRTPARAEAVVALYNDGRLRAVTEASMGDAYDVVINGTSAGLGGTVPRIPGGAIGTATLCYDMSYGREPTPFMQGVLPVCAAAADGLGMLVEQAARSFRIWFSAEVDTAPVIARLRESL